MTSRSALERNCPPPRRKSCKACMRAKRRCNNVQPCMRCFQRNIACVYETTAPRSAATEAPRAGAKGDGGGEAPEPFSTPSSLPVLAALSTPPTPTPSSSCPLFAFDELDTNSFFFDPLDNAPLDHQLLFPPRPDLGNAGLDESEIQMVSTLPNTEASSTVSLVPQLMASLLTLGPSSSQQARMVLSSHLAHAIKILRSAPNVFVATCGLPWCHPKLYDGGMPLIVQDAFSSCALYAAKNTANEEPIRQVLQRRLQDLLAKSAPSASGGADNNMHDVCFIYDDYTLHLLQRCLAHTHALILYMIMGTFFSSSGNNITVRMSRILLDEAQKTLKRTAQELMSLILSVNGSAKTAKKTLPMYPLTEARRVWQEWILLESARRTYMLAIFIVQLYQLLAEDRVPFCDHKLYSSAGWTVSATLWQADGPLEFACAWGEECYFLCSDGSGFSRFLEKGTAYEVDTFTEMFLSSLMGIEEFRGWMASRKAKE